MNCSHKKHIENYRESKLLEKNMNRFGIVVSQSNLIKIFIYTLCLSIMYFKIFESMVYDWIHLPDFSHGFFIPLISAYIVWDRFDLLNGLKVKPSYGGLLILIPNLLLFLLGNLAAESFIMRFSFIGVLFGIIVFNLGWEWGKNLAFPVLFLILMIPIPSILMVKITFPMQLFASNVAVSSLQLLQIPVFQDGNIIQLAHTTLEVAEACSGIRSLISLITLGIVFAYFSQKRNIFRVVLVLLCLPTAIVVNALRVTATGILAQFYGADIATGFFHEFSGFVLFTVAFVFMFLINYLLLKIQPVVKHQDGSV